MTTNLRLNVPYLSHLLPKSEMMTFVLSNRAAFCKIYKGKSQSSSKIPFLWWTSGQQSLSPILSPRIKYSKWIFSASRNKKLEHLMWPQNFSFCPIFTSAKTCAYRCRMIHSVLIGALCVSPKISLYLYTT